MIRWLFPAALLVLAIGLVTWNIRTWRMAVRRERDADELSFARRQFRRRVQASGMLVVLALAMMLGQAIPPRERPTLYVMFWFGVLAVLAWVVLLALGDMVINRQRLARILRDRKIEEARLNAELDRI